MLLHYLVKCRSRILAVYSSECMLIAYALARNIIARAQNHWKSAVTRLTTSCGVCFASESIVQRSRTLTNWNDASTANRPLCVTYIRSHLTCSRRVASASTRLHLCCRRTFLAHAVIKMVWCDTCDFSDTVIASRVCCNSVNHSNVNVIIALTAQSDTSNFPRWCKHLLQMKWALYVHFCYGFIPWYSGQLSLKYVWNTFMFDRLRAKDKLAPFFETWCIYSHLFNHCCLYYNTTQ